MVVTHQDAEKLRVSMADFDHALLYDLKPSFGISDKQLDSYVYNGEFTGITAKDPPHQVFPIYRYHPLGAVSTGNPGCREGGNAGGGQ